VLLLPQRRSSTFLYKRAAAFAIKKQNDCQWQRRMAQKPGGAGTPASVRHSAWEKQATSDRRLL